MRPSILAAVALALALPEAHAQAQLDQLIEKNVQDAVRTYEETLEVIEPTEPPRLWIHIQNDGQRRLAQTILDGLADDELNGGKIEPKPVQMVNRTPRQSQLRYFKSGDAEQAGELAQLLGEYVPELQLRVLS